MRISEHDQDVRVKQAEKFISQQDKVKIEMILKGREKQHKDLARKIINNFIESVNKLTPTTIEQPINIQGGKFSVVIARK